MFFIKIDLEKNNNKSSINKMKSLPTEIISKIMVFHSNVRFDKNELIMFVRDWEIVKNIQDENWEEGTDDRFDDLEKIIYSTPLVMKFYHRYVGYNPKTDLSHPLEDYFIPPILPVD
jgi:hypothetical protein